MESASQMVGGVSTLSRGHGLLVAESSVTMKIQERPLQKNNPGIACQSMKSPPVLVLRPRLVGLRSSWPPCTDARKLYASRRHFWWVPASMQAVAVVWSTADHRPLLGLYSPALMAAVYIAACAPIVLRSFLRKKPNMACRWMHSPDQPCSLSRPTPRSGCWARIQPRRQWFAGVPEPLAYRSGEMQLSATFSSLACCQGWAVAGHTTSSPVR